MKPGSHRQGGVCRAVHAGVLACAMFAVAACTGCKTQQDAVAAAQQMAETAATMQRYYTTLDAMTQGAEDAQQAQVYLNGVPFDADARRLLADTRAELQKRALLAQHLAVIASSFAEITNASAAQDAARAAADLNTELVTLRVAPDSAKAADVLRVAVTSLVNAVRARDEVKAAKILEPLLAAVCGFFDAERPTYVSWADSYYTVAASNAVALIDKDQVVTGERYRSSVAPFGLSVVITDATLKTAVREDLRREVADRLTARKQEDAQAAAALSESLHRMQSRVATVADHKALRVRVPPLSLEGVKAWIAEVQTETGVNL